MQINNKNKKNQQFPFSIWQSSIYGVGDVRFERRPTTAMLRKSKTAEILTTEKPRDRNPVLCAFGYHMSFNGEK